MIFSRTRLNSLFHATFSAGMFSLYTIKKKYPGNLISIF